MNGWEARYHDHGRVPATADLRAYVYKGPRSAKRAFRHVCSNCKTTHLRDLQLTVKGKAERTTADPRLHCYALYGRHANIYLSAIACARRSASLESIKYDAAFEITWMDKRAIHLASG